MKNKNILFFIFIFTTIFLTSAIIYGENMFFTKDSFVYKNNSKNIDIHIEKNEDLNNMQINFVNKGSCDVYLRAFISVCYKSDVGVVFNNSSIKINYNMGANWYIRKDNYIYYTEILKTNNKTKKSMVNSIDINLSDEEKEFLKEDKLEIDVIVEAVQADKLAYKYHWNIEEDELEKIFSNDKINKFESTN